MTSSPFDLFGDRARNADAAAPRGTAARPSNAGGLARPAGAVAAPLDQAYRQMEQLLRELVQSPFITDDDEAQARIHRLIESIDLEDFSGRFDNLADHIYERLEAHVAARIAAGETDEASSAPLRRQPGTGTPRIPVLSPGAAPAPTPVPTAAANSDTQPDAEPADRPARVRSRTRLRL